MKIGFIGGSGHHYLQAALSDPACAHDTFAVAGDGHDVDASIAFAKSVRDVRPDSTAFDDGVAMLDHFKPDVVSIGGVYGYNGDWASAALQRDIAVVTDKPAAATWPQFDRLRACIAVKPSRILLTEFDFRSRPEFRAARAAVANRSLGEIVLVTGQKSYRFGTRPAWYADRAAYPGTLMWVASHALDAIGFVTGRSVTRVTGRGGNLSRPDLGTMEDHLAVLMQLDNGATAVVHADFCRPNSAPTHGDDRFRVVGSRGIVEVLDGRCTLTTTEAPPTDITGTASVEPIHRELLAAAAGGSASPFYSSAESLNTARLLLLARDATDAEQWVDVP